MTLDQNKAIARRMLDWWVSGDVSVVDETNAPDFVSHSSDGGGAVASRCRISARTGARKALASSSAFYRTTDTIDDIAKAIEWSSAIRGEAWHRQSAR